MSGDLTLLIRHRKVTQAVKILIPAVLLVNLGRHEDLSCPMPVQKLPHKQKPREHAYIFVVQEQLWEIVFSLKSVHCGTVNADQSSCTLLRNVKNYLHTVLMNHF